MTGKKLRTAAIIILDSGLSSPNQVLNSGAKAMIGIAFAATASGSRSARIEDQRAAAKAKTTPVVVPMRKPPTASMIVFFADSNSGNRSPFQFSTSAATIADGAGRMNALEAEAADQRLPDDEPADRDERSPARSPGRHAPARAARPGAAGDGGAWPATPVAALTRPRPRPSCGAVTGFRRRRRRRRRRGAPRGPR